MLSQSSSMHRKPHLLNHELFAWTKPYGDNQDVLSNMRRAFRAKVDRAPKFKFGVQVQHCDGANENASEELQEINRDFFIKDSFSEPYTQWQNPVEKRAIKWLCETGTALLDRTGAPEWLWLYAFQYLAIVNNWTAHESLQWRTPDEIRYGITPDISALLAFRFFEKVYYYDGEGSFPHCKELPGYWIGIANNIGDALTFWILTDDKHSVVARSIVRSASKGPLNKRAKFDDDLKSKVCGHIRLYLITWYMT